MAKFCKIIFLLYFLHGFGYPQNQHPSIPINRDFAGSTSYPTGQAEQRIVFENLTADDGLSSGTIRCMIQDSKGFGVILFQYKLFRNFCIYFN